MSGKNIYNGYGSEHSSQGTHNSHSGMSGPDYRTKPKGHGPDTSSYAYDPNTTDYDHYYEDERRYQTQQQKLKQHQRSAEASAQMVYEVYGNVIGILEELEHREVKSSKLSQNLKRSDIHVPSQSYKKDQDVKSILETQLLLFESQLRSCRSDIRDEVIKNLKTLTLQWNAERHTQKLPSDQKTDKYLAQLFEILAMGRTQHPDTFRERPGDIKGVGREDLEAVIAAQARIGHLDKQFEDPSRRPQTPRIRKGDIHKGAERLLSIRSDFGRYLPEERMDMT